MSIQLTHILRSLAILGLLVELKENIEAIPIDNGVISSSVICNDDSIMVNFHTKNPFQGRIFVKGMSDRQECVKNFVGQSYTPGQITNPSIILNFGVCNMQKSRMAFPQPGMMHSLVTIISFHKFFLTKVDKAYRVQCFYMEAETAVTSNYEVSMLPTDEVRDTGRAPICTYQVRRESRGGPIVKYAKIGEPIFHEWECDGASHRILIKNCYVDDGQGTKYPILDERGCNIDKYIMPTVQYDPLYPKAWVEAHVFKYADKSTVYFQCSVQVCNRQDPNCETLTPPKCQNNSASERGYTFVSPPLFPAGSDAFGRGKRENRQIDSKKRKILNLNYSKPNFGGHKNVEIDLISDPITVIELDDGATLNNGENITVENKTAFQLQLNYVAGSENLESQANFDHGKKFMCMNQTGLITLISFISLICLLILIISVMTCKMTLLKHQSKQILGK